MKHCFLKSKKVKYINVELFQWYFWKAFLASLGRKFLDQIVVSY